MQNFFLMKKEKLLGGFKNVSDVVKTGITIDDLKESNYAVAIYHDQNSNNEFDTFFAIPKEKYGFSNNAKVFLVLQSLMTHLFLWVKMKQLRLILS